VCRNEAPQDATDTTGEIPMAMITTTDGTNIYDGDFNADLLVSLRG
jgi:hypothetical protein